MAVQFESQLSVPFQTHISVGVWCQSGIDGRGPPWRLEIPHRQKKNRIFMGKYCMMYLNRGFGYADKHPKGISRIHTIFLFSGGGGDACVEITVKFKLLGPVSLARLNPHSPSPRHPGHDGSSQTVAGGRTVASARRQPPAPPLGAPMGVLAGSQTSRGGFHPLPRDLLFRHRRLLGGITTNGKMEGLPKNG